MGISDTSKAWIQAVGLTIAVGLAGVMLRPLSLLLGGIVTGPGLLAIGLLTRYIASEWLIWLIGAIPQGVIIYYISLWTYRRPILWQLRIGLVIFAWIGMGVAGWWIVR